MARTLGSVRRAPFGRRWRGHRFVLKNPCCLVTPSTCILTTHPELLAFPPVLSISSRESCLVTIVVGADARLALRAGLGRLFGCSILLTREALTHSCCAALLAVFEMCRKHDRAVVAYRTGELPSLIKLVGLSTYCLLSLTSLLHCQSSTMSNPLPRCLLSGKLRRGLPLICLTSLQQAATGARASPSRPGSATRGRR